ncbi:MAG TPA: hypothetical protein VFA41_21145 [Ktedonobacteraceae bacterium]|jgi:hypothetical protein|nr:hypothetical protein [Ktedonobacteraceae bacterium]
MKLLVSCISTKHSVLKKHWTETSQQVACPLTVLGSYAKPQEDLGGLLCLMEDMGCSQTTVELQMAAGMAQSERGLFITTFGSIHEIDTNLGTIHRDVVSSPLFNALHSISRTRSGYLVASTGLDLLLEFNRDGEILWNWWATDHGFNETPTGKRREIDKSADHRAIRYGTLQQTTHVNSAAELPDGRVLATLFHQGMVVAIDRQSGAWHPVLEGLDHPHAVRVLDEEHFTVADTVSGRALLVKLSGKGGHVEEEIEAGTSWLQDCRYDGEYNCWVLVDGKHSRVVLRRGRSGEKSLAQFELNPEWRLYEACVI